MRRSAGPGSVDTRATSAQAHISPAHGMDLGLPCACELRNPGSRPPVKAVAEFVAAYPHHGVELTCRVLSYSTSKHDGCGDAIGAARRRDGMRTADEQRRACVGTGATDEPDGYFLPASDPLRLPRSGGHLP